MMHEDEYKQIMEDVLREYYNIGQLTIDDEELLKEYAYKLFRCTRDEDVGKLIMKLVMLISNYRMNEKSVRLQHFVNPKHLVYENADDTKRAKEFKKKLQSLYEMMGGERGTDAGNTLKDILLVAYNEPEKFIQKKNIIETLKGATSKDKIRKYLMRIQTPQDTIWDTKYNTTDTIDEFIKKVKKAI